MIKKSVCLFILCSTLIIEPALCQDRFEAQISGKLSIDNSWESKIYMSHIPSFEARYKMSNEMIVAETIIDSLGHFLFNLDFLPKSYNLYRLHLVKKGDTPATLIIGGKDENHLFLIANSSSNLEFFTSSQNPPFRSVKFKNSQVNSDFHEITQLLFVSDSIASESSASKRALIQSQLQKDLRQIADTSDNLLVSLYAIYSAGFQSNNQDMSEFFKSYLGKWNESDSEYLMNFKDQLQFEEEESNSWIFIVGIVFLSVLFGFLIYKKRPENSYDLEKLSVQERKIYKLLQQGASNQEISDQFNIGLSTVKSHVSSIYAKLKVKSRKDIIKLP